LDLPVNVRYISKEVDDGLHHLLDGLLELSMLLGQDGYLVAEEIPVTGGFAQCDNGDEESGSRCEIRRLSANYVRRLGTALAEGGLQLT
jgi:hypothetical protein